MAAILDIISKIVDRSCEMMYIFLWLLQKMEGKAKSASASYTGKRAYRINCIFQQL